MTERFDFTPYLGTDDSCPCGRTHACDVRAIDIGPGALERMPALVREMGFARVHIIADLNTWEAAGAAAERALADAGIPSSAYVLPFEEPIPDEHVIGALFAHFDSAADLVLAVGSGTLNDLAKFLSYRCGVEYMVLASAPSMDGFVSIGSPLIIDHMKTTIDTHGPVAVIGDADILAAAPMEMIAAGVGDVLGKYTALLDWRLSQMINGEYYCERTVGLVRDALAAVARLAPAIPERDPEAVCSVMEALVLTGIAMAHIGNSRPAAGSEHHMSHVWELHFQMAGRKAVLHGAKVGIAEVGMVRLYELLASAEPDFDAAREREFDEEKWLQGTRATYLDATPAIVELERKAGKNDVARRNARIDRMQEIWPEIRAEIEGSLPAADELRRLIAACGGPTRPQDVGIEDWLVAAAVHAGKDVRDRWTLLQMLWDLGLDDEFAARLVMMYGM